MIHPIRHFITITKHRHKVIRYCFKVGIGFQGLAHDLSKYSLVEFWNGAKNYVGTYSPNALEREKRGYSLAWMHHKGRNKHHFEYWSDSIGDVYGPVVMPIKYVKESLCDRIAASKVYLKKDYTSSSALEYFNRRNDKEMMHPETARVLGIWLLWVSELGEKAALKRIRKIKNYADMEEYYED